MTKKLLAIIKIFDLSKAIIVYMNKSFKSCVKLKMKFLLLVCKYLFQVNVNLTNLSASEVQGILEFRWIGGCNRGSLKYLPYDDCFLNELVPLGWSFSRCFDSQFFYDTIQFGKNSIFHAVNVFPF